jgi:DNA processing protein
VGTREPSTFGETATREIARALAGDGWSIVSGLAHGVDTLAHREALAHGAPAIAILGNGLDQTYPKASETLAQEILDADGLLLSELPFGAPAIPRNLIARDRIQSGISAAVIVTQTGIKGGAMHTARFAAEQARPLFCPVPHGENGKSEGLRVLLERPANELDALLPAWSDARALCRRLGPRPLALPIERATLTAFLDELEIAAERPSDLGQQQLLFAATNA